MRVVFLATGDIALPAWEAMISEKIIPLALVTQPDKPVGRHQVMTPPAIKNSALQHGIPVMQPPSLRNRQAREAIENLRPDVIVVMAYGQILTERFLSMPNVVCINLHASLLPKYRGAACIQASLEAGDLESGISVIHVVRELDAGDIILQQKLTLAKNETAESLHDRLALLAASSLIAALTEIKNGHATRTPQDPSQVSYIGKLERADGRIDWQLTAEKIERRIRAYHTWPGTYAEMMDGSRMKIFPPTSITNRTDLAPGKVELCPEGILVGCADKAILLTEIQLEGGKKMSAAQYARGLRSSLVFKE